MHKLPTYEIFLEDMENIALALVENPAIEKDFIYFSAEEVSRMEFNEEQMIVKGPALIPNKKIRRNDNLGERNVFMSEDTVRKFAENLINKQGYKFNLGHTDNIIEANIVESYFASEPNEFGSPKGSWIVALKLKSIDTWNKVKNGEIKGFSVEGLFSNELSKFNTNINITKKMDLKEKIMAAVNVVLFGAEESTVEVVVEPVIVEPVVVESIVEEVVEVPVVEEPVVVAEEFAELPTDVPVVEEDVQLTPELVQGMIDESLASAVELILQKCKELIDGGAKDTEVAMAAMKTKIEEFGAQPLSVPVTNVIPEKDNSSVGGYQKYKESIASFK